MPDGGNPEAGEVSSASPASVSPPKRSAADRAELHRELAQQAADTARRLLSFGSRQSATIYAALEVEHRRAAQAIERRDETGEITSRRPGFAIDQGDGGIHDE